MAIVADDCSFQAGCTGARFSGWVRRVMAGSAGGAGCRACSSSGSAGTSSAYAGAVGDSGGIREGSPADDGPAGHQGAAAWGRCASPSRPNAANYDESKADVYPKLPDPLVLKNGAKRDDGEDVVDASGGRRLWSDFDREILGRMPAHLPKVTWEVVSITHEKNGDVPVVTKTLVGHVDNSSDGPQIKVNIDLTLTTPADAKGPVPVIMELGLQQGVHGDAGEAVSAVCGGSRDQGPTWQQQVLARGWGYAE